MIFSILVYQGMYQGSLQRYSCKKLLCIDSSFMDFQFVKNHFKETHICTYLHDFLHEPLDFY